MKVNWYSYHVKPILDVEELGGIVVASKGKLYHTQLYNKQTNDCFYEGDGYCIQFNLSDPTIDGWCYWNDLYPTKSTI